jgi:hypothetical protein
LEVSIHLPHQRPPSLSKQFSITDWCRAWHIVLSGLQILPPRGIAAIEKHLGINKKIVAQPPTSVIGTTQSATEAIAYVATDGPGSARAVISEAKR